MNAEHLQPELGIETLKAARLAEEQQTGDGEGLSLPGWGGSIRKAQVSQVCVLAA